MRCFYFVFTAFLISGCVFRNECGFSSKYYNDCVEGYDAQGIYFRKCGKNDIYDTCKKEPSPLNEVEECINCN
ncbi:MAG: hypothetical protein LBU73_04720 [Helicobacteraceae bacterium]|nr:hypothetical protein [Helicobacteraceae bacterium]